MGFFGRLKEGLARTRNTLVQQVRNVLVGHKKIDEDLFEEIEETLLAADVGVETTLRLISELRKVVQDQRIEDSAQLYDILRELIRQQLQPEPVPVKLEPGVLNVILVVGVNGVGKTTTIAKLAYLFKESGHKVILAAGDTFRAAAIEQLEVWGSRLGVDVIGQQEGSDPAAVVYDALQAGRARRANIVIVDTAGRLHNKVNLMEELSKVKRVIAREVPGAPQEVLLVLDATTGQNALQQSRVFTQAVDVTGIVLTKLDGTAKGGMAISVYSQLNIPIKFIGVGEKMDDLREFSPHDFVAALFDRDA